MARSRWVLLGSAVLIGTSLVYWVTVSRPSKRNLTFTPVSVVTVLKEPNHYTLARFNQIQEGMTIAEVEVLLGKLPGLEVVKMTDAPADVIWTGYALKPGKRGAVDVQGQKVIFRPSGTGFAVTLYFAAGKVKTKEQQGLE